MTTEVFTPARLKAGARSEEQQVAADAVGLSRLQAGLICSFGGLAQVGWVAGIVYGLHLLF